MSNVVPATLAKDAYKAFHPLAYHPEVSEVYANYINRYGRLSNIPTKINLGGVVNIGAQRFCEDFLIGEFNDTFFNLDEDVAIEQHARVFRAMLGREFSDERLRNLHKLGYLPLRLKTLPEGTITPYGVTNISVRSTKDGFQWLTNSIETVMSCEVSGISTSCTTATAYLKTFIKYARLTGLDEEFCKFQGHDFSMRGMIFGREGAYISGLGHLASGLAGTDTMGSVLMAEKFYGANLETDLIGVSVDATEHSVTCSWIEEGEEEFCKYLMSEASPSGDLSVVADTWDFEKFVCVTVPNLKEAIMARDGSFIIRPDTGCPVKVLTGYTSEEMSMDYRGKFYPLDDDGEVNYSKTLTQFEIDGLIETLWNQFGGTLTDKGYKLLDEHIGAIYGDSITLERQELILQRLMNKGFASKVVLGIGSYTYQYVTRDTHGSAVKATSMIKDGRRVAIFKDPKGDSSKKSAKGLLYVGRNANGLIHQVDDVTIEQEETGLLETIFLDGKMVKTTTLKEIRALIMSQVQSQLK
jgi:nicotinamide phosphoribosyltransferase